MGRRRQHAKLLQHGEGIHQMQKLDSLPAAHPDHVHVRHLDAAPRCRQARRPIGWQQWSFLLTPEAAPS